MLYNLPEYTQSKQTTLRLSAVSESYYQPTMFPGMKQTFAILVRLHQGKKKKGAHDLKFLSLNNGLLLYLSKARNSYKCSSMQGVILALGFPTD